jgi:hypothetical protein
VEPNLVWIDAKALKESAELGNGAASEKRSPSFSLSHGNHLDQKLVDRR